MSVAVTLDRSSPVPLYHQLAIQLETAIADGVLEKGSLLGNEIDLAEGWRVSRPTVRRAIGKLVDEGYLVRRRGIGTQVISNDIRRQFSLTSLHDDLVAAGRTSRCDVLDLELRAAPKSVAESLGFSSDKSALFIRRRRIADNVPLAIVANWLRPKYEAIVTVTALTDQGLYALLRDNGVEPYSATQRVGAKVASRDEARLLDIKTGAPLVTMHRVMQDRNGQVIEVADTVYDAAQYAFEMTVLGK